MIDGNNYDICTEKYIQQNFFCKKITFCIIVIVMCYVSGYIGVNET